MKKGSRVKVMDKNSEYFGKIGTLHELDVELHRYAMFILMMEILIIFRKMRLWKLDRRDEILQTVQTRKIS